MTNRVNAFIALLILGLSTFMACKKQATFIGAEVYDPELLLDANGVDTFSIVCYSENLDSALITKSARHALLGTYRDNEVGRVDAGFYTQVRLAANAADFGDINTIVVDSIMLALEYRDVYGSGGIDQQFAVYRLTEDMDPDELYTSLDELATDTENLIHDDFLNIIPNPAAPTYIDTILLARPQLRLRLKDELGDEIINASESGYLENNEVFLDYFKGLHVTTQVVNVPPSSGAVYGFDLIDPDSKITIYYTQDGERKTFDLVINNNAERYNNVKYDDLGTTPLAQLLANPLLGQNKFFIQNGSVRAVVAMPTVQNLSPQTVIHRATLYLPYAYFPGADEYPSPSLTAFNRRVDGDLIWGLQNNGGVISPIAYPFNPNFKRYVIDVTSFVQGLIKQDPLFQTPELHITGFRTNDNVERIVFNGVNSSNKYQPKLIITYTEF
jgi:hypothetical protein